MLSSRPLPAFLLAEARASLGRVGEITAKGDGDKRGGDKYLECPPFGGRLLPSSLYVRERDHLLFCEASIIWSFLSH